MPKIISQGAFDDALKENIKDLELGLEEAREETIKQFEAQGVNLANIIKNLSINEETGQPKLNEAVEALKNTGNIITTKEELQKHIENLKILEEECKKSLPHRVLAAKLDAYPTLLSIMHNELELHGAQEEPSEVLLQSLKAMNSITHKQPDLFNDESIKLAALLLKRKKINSAILTLQWLRKACVMHEINRQRIIQSAIMDPVKTFVENIQPDELFREVLGLLRYLVLDDDIRVEFGNAHEHARQLAQLFVIRLTNLLVEYTESETVADLLLTISCLSVRQEVCTLIDEAGGLKWVINIIGTHLGDPRVNREALKLLRALAGNDLVKTHIVQAGVAPIIKSVLVTNMANEHVVAAALACISTLTLRVKENSVAFFETGISETIVNSMQLHSKSKIVQRNGAWAIRNMVSRSRDQCDTWLSFGIEDCLNQAMAEHPSVQQDVKAALRDLGCKVDLREEWTGTAEKKILNQQ